MSERLDILTPSQAKLPCVVVNNAVTHVEVTYPGGVDNTLVNGYGQSIFAKGDNLIILSMGVVFPLSFQLHVQNNIPFIPLRTVFSGVANAKNYYFRELNSSGSGTITLPMENYEISLGIFIDIQNQNPNTGEYIKDYPFTLKMELMDETYVSMVGAPASLNGTIQRLIPFVKVLHNFALS